MAERPVINASPLIFLSRAGLIHLLNLFGPEIVVPEPVATEIRRRGGSDVTVRTLDEKAWLVIEPAVPTPPEIQAWGLGLGETSVLAWALAHPGTEAIIDDLAGRRCAAVFGIPVRGTLGIVLVAKQRGEIPAARPVLMELRGVGMYLSDRVMNQALAMVGE